ncbi:SEC23-interacting protein isoform X1 [Conger conger]|uniref:SEC23-interacting protein isoform X1 n=1 Tax=Conger conger TaxID=82655 RepID=UPI002A59A8AE|nr:SEC23-interacting protein isoform X1 [Conger conger]
MAEKKNNTSSSTNLLFTTAPQLNFNLPFIPVSQACGPAVLSGDDSVEVGEEDSFLGQSSGIPAQPSTLNYFSGAANSNDPFACIGARPGPSASPFGPAVTAPARAPSPLPPAALPQPPATLPQGPPAFQPGAAASPLLSAQQCPPVSQFGTAVFQRPQQSSPSPPAPPQGYNPYRHTPLSSRANPYLAPPELQPHHAPPQLQHAGFPPPTPPSAAPPLPQPGMPPPTQGQVPPISAGPLVPAPPTMPYTYPVYEQVQPHWFFCKHVESKNIWLPFSVLDSVQLEETFNSVQPDPESVQVRTDGGRYDVQLYDRLRSAVFWEEEPSEVRRCTWFYKGDTDSRFIPYCEEFSDKLESEYKKAVFTNQWHRRLEFPTGETIVMHNPKVIVQFQASAVLDEWGTTQDGQTRPRVVKRGIDDDHDEIPDGELPQVDHLVFMVHGIGPVCDLRFRTMVECVDDFRSVSLKLLHSHFPAHDERQISRVEFLPVQWHTALHGDATGVDRRIKKITLPSTGRLRHFTNETLLDVLFYNSPTYCQTIMDTVAMEMNRLYTLFQQRNPQFRGGISVAGHSLGSLILFDLLSNQKTGSPSHALSPANGKRPVEEKQAASSVSQTNGIMGQAPPPVEEPAAEEGEEFPDLSAVLEHLSLSDYLSTLEDEKVDMESLLMCTVEDLKEMGIPLGPRKKIAKFVKERASKQEKAAQRAANAPPPPLAPPIQSEPIPAPHPVQSESTAGTLSVHGAVSSMPVDYDYFEVGTGQVSVVYPSLDFQPVSFFALGSPIGMFLTVRGLERIEETYQLPTCRGFFNIYHPLDPVAYRIEPLIVPDLDLKPVLIPHHKGRKRLHLELKESLSRMGSDLKHGFISSLKTAWQTLNDFARAHTSSPQLQAELEKVANQIIEEEEKQGVAGGSVVDKIVESPDSSKEEDPLVKIGMLNGGKRIDYVLQEKPIESFNEYLFALQSHLCYWESEDTALLILKEIYKTMGISPEPSTH